MCIRDRKRVLEGIKVDEENLAFDVIAEEGGSGGSGSFLKTKHTRKHYKTEWMPTDVTDRRTFSTWEKEAEKKDIRKRACSNIDKLLAVSYTHLVCEENVQVIEDICIMIREELMRQELTKVKSDFLCDQSFSLLEEIKDPYIASLPLTLG